ncbi:uncharacterized protein LOC112553747 isoform X2 [Pomacea canaliculata]|uniref:uncharacterized protein LOC112553747 isoform X2 n=1 Tax=Pomacea canaliculata TaxID=400727 RepID=UPI000D733CE6|nr:uncharacterized protein LOC112553747 isoform X2 [Pomacea canaliculata]
MDTMLPNGPLQVVFSFDTTGSMSGAIAEVRGRISDMLQRLQSDIPGVTTAVVAHGDYCDADSLYLTKHIDFSNNLPELVDFVNNVSTTGGGDTPEAYEVMLRLVRRTLGWQTGSQRVLVVIGDAYPHPPNDKQNKEHIDWEEETTLLAGMGVRIYGVQVNSDKTSTNFFRTMANITGGQHLKLSEFSTLCDAIMAICYREKGAEFLQNWEAEVRARDGRKSLHSDLDGVFGTLRRADSNASATDIAKVIFTKATPVKATTGVKKANSRARKMSHKVGKTASKPSKKPRAKSFASKSNSSPTFQRQTISQDSDSSKRRLLVKKVSYNYYRRRQNVFNAR